MQRPAADAPPWHFDLSARSAAARATGPGRRREDRLPPPRPGRTVRREEMLLPTFGRFGTDPFAEMRRMQNDLNRMFAGVGSATAQNFPPINLWIGDNSVVVTAEVPGVGPDEIDLTVHEDMLTLQLNRESKASEAEVV